MFKVQTLLDCNHFWVKNNVQIHHMDSTTKIGNILGAHKKIKFELHKLENVNMEKPNWHLVTVLEVLVHC